MLDNCPRQDLILWPFRLHLEFFHHCARQQLQPQQQQVQHQVQLQHHQQQLQEEPGAEEYVCNGMDIELVFFSNLVLINVCSDSY